MYDILFENVRIVDGSGNEEFRCNLASLSSSIALIGKERIRARRIIRGGDYVLLPGFIDIHAHSEIYALKEPDMKLRLQQGITTDLVGNCGVGVYPVNKNCETLFPLCDDVLGKYDKWSWSDFASFSSLLKEKKTGINLAFLQAHSPLRVFVMGEDSARSASDEEIEAMCALLDESLSQGCLGFSTGLYYQPCYSADERELSALLKVVKKHDALFSVHMRSEGDDILPSLEEVLKLAYENEVRLEISHLKIIGSKNQDKLSKVLETIHSWKEKGVRVAFDQYPYNFGSTSLFSLLPPQYLSLSRTELRFALQLEGERNEMRKEILNPNGWESLYLQSGGEAIRILHLDGRSDLDGLSLKELSEKMGMDELDVLFDVLSEERGAALMCDETESEETMYSIMSDDLMTYGGDALYSVMPSHPRSLMGAVEYLKKAVCEKKLYSLEEAVSRLTFKNALKMGLGDRGLLKEAKAADLVLIDEKLLTDDPLSAVKMVIVNGQVAYENGKETGNLAGRVLI